MRFIMARLPILELVALKSRAPFLLMLLYRMRCQEDS
jgi:hypothetical protein